MLQFTLPGSPNLYYGSELGMTGNSRLRNPFRLLDLVGTSPAPQRVFCGLVEVTLSPHGFMVLQPEVQPAGGYSSHKRGP